MSRSGEILPLGHDYRNFAIIGRGLKIVGAKGSPPAKAPPVVEEPVVEHIGGHFANCVSV